MLEKKSEVIALVKLTGYYQLPGAIPQSVDFEDLPEEQMDKHVVKNTRFSSWGEMIDFATDIYARKQDKKMS